MHSSSAQPDLVPAQSPAELIQRHTRTRWHIALILGLWLVLYVPGLFSPALLDDADSVHAEAAREMLLRHDWSTLYINNGFRYLEKAPLMYWGMIVSYKAFGVSEWSARLPVTLGMLGLLLSTYFFARKRFGESAGLYSSVVLATSFGPYIFTRILIPDLLVAWFLLITLDFFLRGLESEKPSKADCWGLAAASALNVLTKGLIGIVFPGGIILGYLILTGNLKHLARMRLVSSFLVFMAIAAPWHIVAGLRNPAAGQARGFFWFYFINEHFLRYLNERFPKDYDTVPLFVFWGMLFLWLVPWSAFAFHALADLPIRPRAWVAGVSSVKSFGSKIASIWRNLASYGQGLPSRERALLLCGMWILFIVGFFSFSSRQEYYNIPALPALAVIIGAWLGKEQKAAPESPIRRSGRRILAAIIAVVVPFFTLAMFLLWKSESVPKGTELSDVLTKNPGEYALSFGHIFDLTPRAMGFFRAPLAISATAVLLGAIVAWWLRRRNFIARSNLAITLMMIVFLQCAHSALVTFAPILSSKSLSQAVERVYKPGDVVVINGAYEDGSTLNFYGHFQLHVINTRDNGNLYYGSLFPDSPKVFENDTSFKRLWDGDRRVFLWTEKDDIPRAVLQTQYFQIAKSGGKYILSNQANSK
ncbi:MAG: glycosyltransferase family 39 protein [Terriglobia bacterium]|jgi:4-amino-4-deoxy-L-arabinose transferase-like glycosyltransferase|nr:glycosyltransferase family 39 protein [Terriglobia bacterium]